MNSWLLLWKTQGNHVPKTEDIKRRIQGSDIDWSRDSQVETIWELVQV